MYVRIQKAAASNSAQVLVDIQLDPIVHSYMYVCTLHTIHGLLVSDTLLIVFRRRIVALDTSNNNEHYYSKFESIEDSRGRVHHIISYG